LRGTVGCEMVRRSDHAARGSESLTHIIFYLIN
jgi:hypothetical protein